MSPEQFEKLSETEFGQLIESQINFVAQGAYDLPADVFWALWVTYRVKQIEETSRLQGICRVCENHGSRKKSS